MAGIRLHHPTFRAGEGTTLTYVVELPTKYPRPKVCPRCTVDPDNPVVHDNKSLHLALDRNGDVIVSRESYEALKKVFLAGMEFVNEVPNPPPVYIGAVPKDKERIIYVPLNSDNARAPIITPAHTAYESRDKMRAPLNSIVEGVQEAQEKAAWEEKRKDG